MHPVFSAPAGLHAHFPAWSRDGAFIYFVQGELPDKLDVWRMTATGAGVERMTNHNGRVSHPVFIDRDSLYLTTDADGQGPWLYSLDVHTRETRRVLAGVDRYTSLAAAGAGTNLVMTVTHPKRTLWRVLPRTSDGDAPSPTQVGLPNGTGFFPRLGRDVVVYGSTVGGREHLWKLADREPVDLWSAADATMISAPARIARSRTGRVLGPGQGPHAALCPSDRWLGPAGPDRFPDAQRVGGMDARRPFHHLGGHRSGHAKTRQHPARWLDADPAGAGLFD